jgi:hypothetical protein
LVYEAFFAIFVLVKPSTKGVCIVNKYREYVWLNGTKVFVDAIESITPYRWIPNTTPDYKVRCKSGATYCISKRDAQKYGLI